MSRRDSTSVAPAVVAVALLLIGCDRAGDAPPAAAAPDAPSAADLPRAANHAADADADADSAASEFPAFRVATDDAGLATVEIDHAAYVAACAAHDLPAPPAPQEVDHVTFGLIHGANVAAAREATPTTLGALAMFYDGNDLRPQARAVYQQLVALEPRDAQWWNLLGRAQFADGAAATAVESFERAITLRPTHGAAHARLAEAALAIGDVDRAATASARAVSLLPNDRFTLNVHAQVAVAQQDWEAAADAFDVFFRVDPRYKPALQQRAIVDRQRGRLDEAALWLERAAALPEGNRLNPRDPDEQTMLRASQSAAFYKGYSTALFRQKRYGEAYDAVRELLRRQPNLALYQRNAAALAKLNGDLEAAIEHARRAVAINPRYAKGHTVLAELLRDTGRIDDAVAAAEHAVELDPADPTNHLSLGAIRLSGGDAAGALADLERGLAEVPNHLTGLCLAARCHIELKNEAAARGYLDRVLALQADHPWALNARRALDAGTPLP